MFSHSVPQCCIILSSTIISLVTALLNLLTACVSFHGLAVQGLLLIPIPILFTFLMQYLTTMSTLSSLLLVNSRTFYFSFPLPSTQTVSKEQMISKKQIGLSLGGFLRISRLFSCYLATYTLKEAKPYRGPFLTCTGHQKNFTTPVTCSGSNADTTHLFSYFTYCQIS